MVAYPPPASKKAAQRNDKMGNANRSDGPVQKLRELSRCRGVMRRYAVHRGTNGRLQIDARASRLRPSGYQRRAKAGDQLDQIGLAADAGLGEQAADMRLDSGVGDAKGGCYLGDTADVDDGEQHA